MEQRMLKISASEGPCEDCSIPRAFRLHPDPPVMGEASYSFGRSQEQHQGLSGPFGLKWDNCALCPRPPSQPAFIGEGEQQGPGFTWFKAQVRAGASQAWLPRRESCC